MKAPKFLVTGATSETGRYTVQRHLDQLPAADHLAVSGMSGEGELAGVPDPAFLHHRRRLPERHLLGRGQDVAAVTG